ncbi:MAG: glycosyltransferase family 39 protein [Magnetococcales bacterium]|nr:glycosyltransferase family 39 protein [Magnetococcales bacterium]
MSHPTPSRSNCPTRLLLILALVAITAIGLHLRLGAVFKTDVSAPLRKDALQYYLSAYNLKYHDIYSSRVGQRPKSAESGEAFLNQFFADPLGRYLAGHNLRRLGIPPPGEGEVIDPASPPPPDAHRSPGYPLFLYPFLDLPTINSQLLHITFAQALLSALAVVLVYFTCLRFTPPLPALAAALLTALSPHLVTGNHYLLTESLFTFLLVLFFWVASRLKSSRGWGWFFLSGLLLGFTTLVRPEMLLYGVPVVGMVWLLFDAGTRKRRGLILLLGIVLLFAPWIARNKYHDLGHSRAAALTRHMAHGIYPGMMYQENPQTFGYPYHFDPDYPRLEGDMGAVLGEIQRRFSNEPARHGYWFFIGKPIQLWSWNMVQGAGDALIYPVTRTPYATEPFFKASHQLMHLLHWPLVILGGVGLLIVWLPSGFMVWREAQDPAGMQDQHQAGTEVQKQNVAERLIAPRLMSLLLMYVTALHMVTLPLPRYAIPLKPLLHILAMVALYEGYRLVRRVWRKK